MPWNMTAVNAPSSSVKIPLEKIDPDTKAGVDEAYAYGLENPGQRFIVAFDTANARDTARNEIRSYCEAREDGRLTASIWAGFAGVVEGTTKFSQTETEVCKAPALSLSFSEYVKRSKNGSAPAATESPSE